MRWKHNYKYEFIWQACKSEIKEFLEWVNKHGNEIVSITMSTTGDCSIIYDANPKELKILGFDKGKGDN